MNLATSPQISTAHIRILEKDLSFIPTATLCKDAQQSSHRRLKLEAHFNASDKLEISTSHLHGSHTMRGQRNERANLSKEEEQSLKDLATLSNIMIKPADRGSVVVIMDRKDKERCPGGLPTTT